MRKPQYEDVIEIGDVIRIGSYCRNNKLTDKVGEVTAIGELPKSMQSMGSQYDVNFAGLGKQTIYGDEIVAVYKKYSG